MKGLGRAGGIALMIAVLAGCGGSGNTEGQHPVKGPDGRWIVPGQQNKDTPTTGTNVGELFDFGDSSPDPANAIGINRFLWQATIDVLSNLPLASADPYGGVVITEWSASTTDANERTKLVASVRGVELTSRGVSVTVYREIRDENGEWTPAPVAPSTATSIEESIIGRARQVRIADRES